MSEFAVLTFSWKAALQEKKNRITNPDSGGSPMYVCLRLISFGVRRLRLLQRVDFQVFTYGGQSVL